MAADTLRRAHAALDQLVAAGARPSVTAVARATGVARSTIYRHPELLDAITAARDRRQAHDVAATAAQSQKHVDGRRETDARLRDEIASLRATVDQLAQTVQTLTLDNDRLRRELAAASDTVATLPPVSQGGLEHRP